MNLENYLIFYFNPSASALTSTYKYKICTLLVVNSKINAVDYC